MELQRIDDFDPSYRTRLATQAIVGYRIHSGERQIGVVDDLIVDKFGRFRYLVVHPSAWILGKQVLLPLSHAWIDTATRQIFAPSLNKEQAKALPRFTTATIVDSEYEAQVSRVYQQAATRVNRVVVRGETPVYPTAVADSHTLCE